MYVCMYPYNTSIPRRYLTLNAENDFAYVFESLTVAVLYNTPYYCTMRSICTRRRYGSDARLWRYVTKLDYGESKAPMRLTDVFQLRLLSVGLALIMFKVPVAR